MPSSSREVPLAAPVAELGVVTRKDNQGVRTRNGKYSVNGILSVSCAHPYYALLSEGFRTSQFYCKAQ